MLDFMYRGEASVRQEDLAAFLKLAETLKVKGLAGDKGSVSLKICCGFFVLKILIMIMFLIF